MKRLVFHFGCVAVLLMLGFTSCRGQTVSRCQPERDLPQNPKPGVVGLNLSRDGKTLVTAGADGKIRIWNVATGQVERTLSGHTNSLYKADFSPNEKLLASSSRDRTARIWDFATGRELYKLTGFRCSVKSVAFSPNGKTLAVVGNDGMLKLWDVETGKELKSLVHSDLPDVDISVYSVVFSRDGRKIYAGNGDGTISEWDAETGKETRNWKAHGGTVFALAFNSDYSLLASGSEDEANVKLWNTATWREIRTFGEKRTEGLLEQLHPVAFSPDGKLIAAGFVGFDEKQRQYVYHRTIVWNTQTGEKLFTFEGHKLDIGALVFTPDNRSLISGSSDTTIKFWDLKTGQEARTFTQQLQREVAITFDDLPAPRGDFETMKYVTTNLLKSVEANKVPAVGFVNEGKLYVGGKPDSRRVALLEMWLSAGLELGNHTFSHVQIDETPLPTYKKDVTRGEIITINLLAKRGKKLRYFRHPQLRTGPTPEYKSELDKFLRERRYTIAPVTIDNNENVIAQVYAKAKQDGDKETMERVADAYIRYMEEIFAFFEKLSIDSLGYEVKQTLLLHANELNADHFDDLARMMRARGYKFVSLEEALKDPAYSLPDAQVTKGLSWLHRWMLAKGDKIKPEPNVPEFISVLYNASADSVK